MHPVNGAVAGATLKLKYQACQPQYLLLVFPKLNSTIMLSTLGWKKLTVN
jgi:hypothetical protein